MAFYSKVEELINEYITKDKILSYIKRIADTPAPSTTSSYTRGTLIQDLLEEVNFEEENLHYYKDYKNTGNSLILTGDNSNNKPLWLFAHLDTISYLIQPKKGDFYPLVPFCYHLLNDKRELPAALIRYDTDKECYFKAASGLIFNINDKPYFKLNDDYDEVELKPGDRIVFDEKAKYNPKTDIITGDLDNAVSVAALLAAAPVLAELNIQALIAFPDEEEGPSGQGNQTFGRGSRRLIDLFPTPNIAFVSDLQKGNKVTSKDNVKIGNGAVLAEFSSMGRGAVTPPHLYNKIKNILKSAQDKGVSIQESNNKYTSRSDDINLFLKTPNVVLLGVPGSDRHFNNNSPSAALMDVINLSKSIVYSSIAPGLIKRSDD